ncbi:MAG: methylated-DNA--[protein]-cysteine S-methyltransferase [Acidobacteria bacterium]|nr:methylated-DNA--[protein]-cysteine S-methyltransferase [Acidobacteriota bacterium]MCA1612167.1 methylated-DNA--[protein]-cysteine S-methyltransferase [Acidobacteriota bacterium]
MRSSIAEGTGGMFEEEFVTRVGLLRAAVDAEGSLVRLEFRGFASEARTKSRGSTPCDVVRRQISQYFEGRRTSFDLRLAPDGTAFQRRVWEELVRIPFGQRTTYGELARRLGRPAAFRAVGAANGANPIAIVIPCHRVVGSDGSLTGYGGGLPMKEWLLAHEAGREVKGRQTG